MGLLTLDTAVAAWFVTNGVTAKVEFGRRRRAMQINQGPGGANRVIFSPGDPSGKLGKLGPVHLPGQREAANRARSIADAKALVTVYVWACDPTKDPSDERSHWSAALDLQEWTMRAVHEVYGRNHAWGEWEVTPEPDVHVYGVELVSALTISFPFLGKPPAIDFPTSAINKVMRTAPP